ncbi:MULTISPECIES: type VII secretion protein EccB [unclassified Streptomyces]|uniref:type VII secretion protein EccB n=1 Tax=unclassified Streptomyces TaxID=2593676 RepID=UPI0003A48213|nr:MULTISPECIES: type VII secretion protein EccB [unclassified Streptomyces]MYT28997.1 type VII secretion protein EccB [Streptomyces sp. SID8354]
MASRRDELNAYSFARKRTNAAFLKPLPNGSIESAPRPLKAVVPSVVLAVLVTVGFGAVGVFKPVAPEGWDTVGANVLVGDESTTRYVVLESKDANGQKQKLLHPVLNLASAKLLLDPKKFKVVKVKESELDGKLAHGPAVGIPYAPDRLPDAKQVDKPKTWAVCDRPGSGENSKSQQAVFVLDGKDKLDIQNTKKGKLDLHQALYVEDPDGVPWLVDSNGYAFQMIADTAQALKEAQTGLKHADVEADRTLRRIIFGSQAQPQKVSAEFMNTLVKSPFPITMPTMASAGAQYPFDDVPPEARKVGSILQDGNGQKYVVQPLGVAQVSNFVANLLEQGPNAAAVNGNTGKALQPINVATGSIRHVELGADNRPLVFAGKIPETDLDNPWPKEPVTAANDFAHGSQTGGLGSPTSNGVSCSVYKGTTTKFPGVEKLGYPNGLPDMSTWVGKDYPAKIAPGASTYVTPGSGLLYQQVANPKANSGSLFLVTDTGLRYSIPRNNDSASKAGNDKQEQDQAQVHLGYGEAHPPLILEAWSKLLSAGPQLDVPSASKPQAS